MDPIALNMLQYWLAPNAVPTNQFTNANNFVSGSRRAATIA
jgi:hypothetical protein